MSLARHGRAGLPLVAWVAFGACSPSPVQATDVVQVSFCPPDFKGSSVDGGAAACSSQPYADGQSLVFVQVCSQSSSVSSSDRRTDLQVALHSTRGSWPGHGGSDPTSTSVSLGSSPCVVASFVADQQPGLNDIQATLLGYTTDKPLTQVPAPLATVDVGTATLPPLQGTTAATIQLTVSARAVSGGLPSTGTRVQFSSSNVVPAGENVTISPLATTLDASGSATFNVFVPSTITSFTINAAATPPPHPELGVAPLPSVSGHLDISRQ